MPVPIFITYNQNNRLIRVEEAAEILGEYAYNGLGQRITKTVDSATTVFHYDFDGNIIAESDANGTFSAEYLYTDSNRLAKVDAASGILYYYLNNHLGTPVLMTDSSGTVVWEGIYKPFGEADVNENSTVENNFRFAGQYYDEETGLHYNYHRYYDPKTGRYLTPDPIRLEGGLNLYGYTLNNPIKFIDPKGLEVRVYSSDAFRVGSGLNHAFVYSTETGRFKGTDGSSWVDTGDGGGDLSSPYFVVSLPPGMSEDEFMKRIKNAKGWNNWMWTPILNDCHSDLEYAFDQAGVSYPGVPNGRMDIDDNIRYGFRNFMRQLNNFKFFYRLFGAY